jgi:hypothetical protein
MTTNDKYILIGQTPVPCYDLLEWARWFETFDRRVLFTRVLGICNVSTIFLGLDHNCQRMTLLPGVAEEIDELARMAGMEAHMVTRPLLFETMAFWRGGGGYEQDRCSTWPEAEAMHRRMVAEVSRPKAVLSYLRRMIAETTRKAREDWRERWRELRGIKERDRDPHWNEALELFARMEKRKAEKDDRDWIDYE